MKTLHALTLLALLPAAALVSCKTDATTGDTTRRAVDPPLANTVPFRDFTISADAGDTILLDEGTQLYVPPGIFIDKDGKPVKGDVQLHYRAFYTPGEIIASGITMLYDSADAEHIFSSAGMFELTGTQGGEPVTIAPGKNIEMDFGTNRDDMTFSFYALDTVASKWNFKNTPKPEKNALREKLVSELSAFMPRPVEPRKYDAKRPVLDLDVNTEDHPELAGYSGILWQYAGTGPDPDKSKDLYSTSWTSAKLQLIDSTVCTYTLNLANNEKTFTTNVYPALRGDNYEAALKSFKTKMSDFEASEKTRIAKREKELEMAKFQYSLRVPNFGIYNFDGLFPFEDLMVSEPMEFHFDDPEMEKNRENIVVFAVTANGVLVSGFNATRQQKITFVTRTKNGFVAVMRGTNKAAMLDADAFRSSIERTPDKPMRITLKRAGKTVSDSKDLDALIATL